MNNSLIRHGFILIALALLTGLAIPASALPRLALSAHTIGLMSGIFLMVLGAVWGRFTLSDKQKTVLKVSWLYAAYANWAGILFGAMSGAGKMTPIAANGAIGSNPAELVVAILLGSLSLAAIIGAGLAIFGLRQT